MAITKKLLNKIVTDESTREDLNAIPMVNPDRTKLYNYFKGKGGGGIPEADKDGNVYGRCNGSWVKVPKTSDVVTIRDNDQRILSSKRFMANIHFYSNIYASFNKIINSDNDKSLFDYFVAVSNSIGDLTKLSTKNKTNTVYAINEIAEKLLNTVNLTGNQEIEGDKTFNGYTLLEGGAVVDFSRFVHRSNDDKSLFDYFEDIRNTIGDLNSLNTQDKSNIVAAIIEIVAEIIGELDELKTNNKSNIVSAINEISDKNNVKTINDSEYVTVVSPETTYLCGEMNELYLKFNINSSDNINTALKPTNIIFHSGQAPTTLIIEGDWIGEDFSVKANTIVEINALYYSHIKKWILTFKSTDYREQEDEG